MLEFLKRNKNIADILLFLKWDRFSRNAPEAYAMIGRLSKFNIEPQAIKQPLDLAVPENKIMLAIYLTAPEVENDRRALNIIAGMRRAIKDGRFMGHAPYGYKHARNEQNKPCIAPNKDSKLVQYAFDQMATGTYHIEELRRIMNGKGLKVPRTRFWALLRNPFYIGKILVPAYKDEPETVVKGQHEPLISERLFYEVQDVLTGRKRKDLPSNRCQKDELMLRGFLTCSRCGRKLTGSASRGKQGARYFYYHCKLECKERFRADAAHEIFTTTLQSINDKKTIQYFRQIMAESYVKDGQERAAELQKVNKQIQTLQTRLANAKTLMLDGVLPAAEYRETKAEIEPELNKLKRRQVDLGSDDNDEQEMIEFGFYYLKNMPKLFIEADLERKNRILSSTFPERLIFENGKCRTPDAKNILSLITATGAGLSQKKESGRDESLPLSHQVEAPENLSKSLMSLFSRVFPLKKRGKEL